MLVTNTRDLNHHVNMDLEDDNNHHPRGYIEAPVGTTLTKGADENLVYQNTSILPSIISTTSPQSVPPTQVDGDIYILTNPANDLDVDTIVWQSGTTVRITFNGSPDLSAFAAADLYSTSGNTNVSNDGNNFVITTVNDGSDYIEITNPARTDGTDDEATDAPGTGIITLAEWDGATTNTLRNDWVRYYAGEDLWYGISPVEGIQCNDLNLSNAIRFDGTDWVSFGTGGGGGNTIYSSNDALAGNRIVGLATNTLLFDNGTTTFQGANDTSTSDTLIVLNDSGATALKVQNDLKLILKSTAVVSDSDLGNSEYQLYIDETTDIVKARLKDSGGVASDLLFDGENIGSTSFSITGTATRTIETTTGIMNFSIESPDSIAAVKAISRTTSGEARVRIEDSADAAFVQIRTVGSTNSSSNQASKGIIHGSSALDAIVYMHDKTSYGGRHQFMLGTLSSDSQWADSEIDFLIDRREVKVTNGAALTIGPSIPTRDASCIVDIQANDAGLGLPELTTTERNGISSPRAGLLIFNETTSKLNFYSGSGWEAVTSV